MNRNTIAWTTCRDAIGGWYWFSQELPNGWSACVTDHSQTCAPRQQTAYHASASSKRSHVSGPMFDSFVDAQREAILLAIRQPKGETAGL